LGSEEKKQDINYFVEVGLKQLHKSIARQIPAYPETINKFLRWALGQLCFFEHYTSIPIVDGNKEKFYQLVEEILVEKQTYNKIRNFRYQWDYLMDKCVEIQVITSEEAKQYKEVFPIFDPHYISSYEDHTEKHSEVMSHFLNDFKF